MFAGQTVWTILGRLTGVDTTMWIEDLIIVLSRKPIFHSPLSTQVTVFTSIVSFTRTPDCSVSLQELFVVLTAGGVDGEHLI